MQKPAQNKLNSLIGHSGNSDVDLTVNIDTKAIAYSMLCSLYAKGDLNEEELENAIRKLDSLIERDKKNQRNNTEIIENRPQSFNHTQQKYRRKWI